MRRRRKKEEEHKRITDILNERLEVHDESKEKVPKADFNKPCGGLRAQTNEYEEERTARGIKWGKGMTEDNRLQKSTQRALHGMTAGTSQKTIQKSEGGVFL